MEKEKLLAFTTTTTKIRFKKFLSILHSLSNREFSEKEILRKLEEACEDNSEITKSSNNSCTGYFFFELEAHNTKNNQRVLFYFDFKNEAIGTIYLKATHYIINNSSINYRRTNE